MDSHPILFRLAKLGYRIAKPFYPRAKKYLEFYRNHKVSNLYQTRAAIYNDFCFVKKDLNYKPLISIVVPVFNPSSIHLTEMVYSVINQHYPRWELILVNASTNRAIRQKTLDCADIDTRVSVVELKDNLGISGNTNEGIKQAQGEYVAFGDHDDLLHPCALHSVVEALQARNRPQLIYTDEDKVSADSSRYLNPHIKPDWSIDTLRNVNFVTHLMVISKDLVEKAKGLRSVTDGAQDYDLLLRIWDESHPLIKHIPRILYHWRMAPGSTADLVSHKQYIFNAGTRALSDHLKRNKIKAAASHIDGKPGYYKLEYDPLSFSVIVGPVAEYRQAACAAWLQELLQNSRENVELVVGTWFNEFHHADMQVKTKIVTNKENYWLRALDVATYEIAVVFKSAAIPRDLNGLAKFAAAAADPQHSAIAPIITDKSGVIVGGGLVLADGLPKILFEGSKIGTYTWFLDTDWVRSAHDLTTEVIAAPVKNLKEYFADFNYGQTRTLASLNSASEREKSNFVVWAHTPFEILGPLNPNTSTKYQAVEPFMFVPTVNPHVYDWWKDYERAPEE